MSHISVTPIENLLFPSRVPPPRSKTPTQIGVEQMTVDSSPPLVATCIDAAGHAVACAVCKRVGVLEKTLLIIVSAVVSSIVTACVFWRFSRRQR